MGTSKLLIVKGRVCEYKNPQCVYLHTFVYKTVTKNSIVMSYKKTIKQDGVYNGTKSLLYVDDNTISFYSRKQKFDRQQLNAIGEFIGKKLSKNVLSIV